MRPFYRAVRVIPRTLLELLYGFRVEGAENVPREGGMILAVNHVSYADPVVAGSGCPRELHYFAKRELFGNRPFARLIRACGAFPVDRGSVSRSTLREVNRILSGGGALLIFPEGTRSLDGRVRDALPGIGMMAFGSGVPAIPAYLRGTREMGRALTNRGRVAIFFGEPVYPVDREGGSRREKYIAFGNRVVGKIRALQSIYG